MRLKILIVAATLAFLLAGTGVWADHIVLKDGREYSGKFVRGDAGVIEFRILGRIETFNTLDVDRVIFKEPELETTPGGNSAEGTRVDRRLQPKEEPVSGDREPRPREPVRASSMQGDASVTTIPVGTPLTIRTTTVIDTDRNRVGDTFDAILEDPLTIGNQIVAPRGTDVKGRIAYAKESGRISGQSQLILELSEIRIGGKSYAVRTSDYTEIGSARGKRTATAAGGGAALGAIIGAIAGGGKGAAVGAATGAAVGTGTQVLTKGQTLKVPAETILEFKLESPLTIPVS